MEYSEEMIEKVWEKAKVVNGVSPDSYRKDEFGAWIRRCRYNDKSYPLSFGWVIISDSEESNNKKGEIEKLRPLQWQNALSFRNIKDTYFISAEGFYNNYIKIQGKTGENIYPLNPNK
jgi:hypothetical protein